MFSFIKIKTSYPDINKSSLGRKSRAPRLNLQ